VALANLWFLALLGAGAGLVILGLAALTPALAQYPGRLGFWPMWVFLLYSTFNIVVDVEHRLLFPADGC